MPWSARARGEASLFPTNTIVLFQHGPVSSRTALADGVNQRDRVENTKDRVAIQRDRSANQRDRVENTKDRDEIQRDRDANQRDRIENTKDRDAIQRDRDALQGLFFTETGKNVAFLPFFKVSWQSYRKTDGQDGTPGVFGPDGGKLPCLSGWLPKEFGVPPSGGLGTA